MSYPPHLLTDLLRSINPAYPPSSLSDSTLYSTTGLLVELPRALTTLALHSAQQPIPLEAEGGSLIQCFLPPPSHTLRAVQDACRFVARPHSAPNGPSFSLGVCLGTPTHRTRVSSMTNALGLHPTSYEQEDRQTSTVEDACLSRSQLYIVNLVPSSNFSASETYVSHYGGRCVECASAGIPSHLQGTVWLSREEVAKAFSTVFQDNGAAQELLRSEIAWGQHHAHLWATGCLLELLEQSMPTTTLYSLIGSLPISCPIPCNNSVCPSKKDIGVEGDENEGVGEGIYHLPPHSLQRAVCRRDRTRATLSHHPSSPYVHCETLPDDAIPQVDFTSSSDAQGWFSSRGGAAAAESGPALVARWARMSDCLLPPVHSTASLPSHHHPLTNDIPIIMNVPRGAASSLNKPVACIGHFISLQPFLPPVASEGSSLVAFVVDSVLDHVGVDGGSGLCYGSAPNPTLSTIRTMCDFSQTPSMFSLHAHFERFQARIPYPLERGGAGCIRHGLADLLGPREVDPFAPSGLPNSQPPSLQSRTAVKTLLEGFLPRVLGQHVAKTLILHTYLSHSSCVLSPAAGRRLMAVVGGTGYSQPIQTPTAASSRIGSPIPSILVLGQEGSGKSLLLSELHEFLFIQPETDQEKSDGGSSRCDLPYAPVAVGDGSASDLIVVIPPRVGGDISHDPSILPPPDTIRSTSTTAAFRAVHLSRCSGDPILTQRRIGAPQPVKVDSSNHLQSLQQALYTLIRDSATTTTHSAGIIPVTLLVDTAHLASPSDLLHLHYLASVHCCPHRTFPLRVASLNPPFSTATWPRGPSTPLFTIAASVVPDAQDTGAEGILGRLRRLLPSFPLVCFLDRELHDAYNHSLSNRIGNAHSVSVRNSASMGRRMSASHDGGSLLRGVTSSASLSSFDWECSGRGGNTTHCGIMKDVQQHLLGCRSNRGGSGVSTSMGGGDILSSFHGGSADFDEAAASLKTQSLLATIQNTPLYDYLALQMLTTHVASSKILRDPSAHQSGVHVYEVFATPALNMDVENILISRFPHLGWQRPANVHQHREAGTETPQEQVDNADLPTHLSRCLTLIKSRARIDMCGCWEVVATSPSTPSSQFISTVAPIHISDGVELYCMAVQAGHWLLGAVSISTTIQEGTEGDQQQAHNNDTYSNMDAHSTSILADVVPVSLAASGGIAAAASNGGGGKRGRNAPGAKKLSRKEFIAGLITQLHQSCPPGAAKMFARDRLSTIFGAYSQRCGSVAGVGMRGGATVPGMDESIHLLTNEGFLLKVGPDTYKLIGNL